MQKITFAILFVSIACCLALLPQGTSAQNPEAMQPSQKWEYKAPHITKLVGDIETLDDMTAELEKSLNELGDDGWELCLEIKGAVVLKRAK